MIRNHLMVDPEASPSKSSESFLNANNEDWYASNSSSPHSIAEGKSSSFYDEGKSFYNTGTSNNIKQNINTSIYSEEDYDYENELPLLQELGINFDHISMKTLAVLYPTKKLSAHILDDTDLAGPLCFCLLLGILLLLSGKVQFGYIYGFSVFGCLSLQSIINLIHPIGLDFWRTCSVLGYCLIPVIMLAAISILINLKGLLGLILSMIAIAWATLSATRLIDAKLVLTELYWLVAYPLMLLYSCFVIITIF